MRYPPSPRWKSSVWCAPWCGYTVCIQVLLGLRKHDNNVSRQRRREQEEAADAAAARAMTRLLKKRRQCPPPNISSNSAKAARAIAGEAGEAESATAAAEVTVTPAQAAAIRRPESAASANDLAEAARLLGDLGAVAVAVTVSAAMETEPMFANTTSALPMKEVRVEQLQVQISPLRRFDFFPSLQHLYRSPSTPQKKRPI